MSHETIIDGGDAKVNHCDQSKIKKIHMGRLDIFELDLEHNRSIQHKLVDEYARSIKNTGVDKSILVRLNKATGLYTVIDGSHRILACIKVKDAGGDPGWIKYEIDNSITDEKRDILMVRRNTGANMTPIDEAEAFARLLAKGYSQTEIAKETGKSASHISQVLPLADAPKELKRLAHDDHISPTLLRSIINQCDSNWDQITHMIHNILELKKIEVIRAQETVSAPLPVSLEEQAAQQVAQKEAKKILQSTKTTRVTEKDVEKAGMIKKHSRTYKALDKVFIVAKDEVWESTEIEKIKTLKRLVDTFDSGDADKIRKALTKIELA